MNIITFKNDDGQNLEFSQVVKESLQKHDLLSTSFVLVSDDGSENKGAVKWFLKNIQV